MANYDIRIARLRATKLMPYMTKGVMSMVLVEAPGLNTMATDCHLRLYYDNAVLDQWNVDQCAGVILHEMMHCLSRHDVRAKARIGEKPSQLHRQLWNIAADVSINQVLEGSNIKLPDGCLSYQQFQWPPNLSTEEYYDLALKLPVTKVPVDCMGEGTGESAGSMSDGVPREHEQGAPGTQDKDGKDVAHGLGPYERQRLDRVVANDIAEHARKAGNIHSSLTRLANSILKPVFDPRREILAEVKYAINCTKGFGGSTWMLPSRRCTPRGLRIPRNVCPVPKPLLIFDTSGSMNESDLSLCRGVLADVFKSLPSQEGVRVITGDTHIGSCKKAFSQASVELVGGGGTDMGALMEYGAEQYPEADVIIVVTDGYTPWPKQPMHQKCLALLTQRQCRNEVPEWIRTVYIRPESAE
jgi:predicted metal-dependent peptidase